MDRFHKIGETITDNSFIIFMILTFASFAFNVPGVLRALLWIFIVFSNLRFFKINSLMDALIVAYIAGAFFSLTGMLFRPYPLEFFFKVFVDSYIPIIFYFIGRHSSNQIQTKFYSRTLIAILFVYIVGFYYTLTLPPWYVEKTLEIANQHTSYTEDTIVYARFGSFLDSYHVANFGVFALCFAFGLIKTNNRKIVMLFGFISLGIIALAVLLSQQRVALFVGGMLFIYYLQKSFKNKITLFGVLCVIFIIFSIILQFFDDTMSSQVLGRFSNESRSSMVSSRTSQWIEAITGVIEPIFGNGIGSGGYIAYEHGMSPSIADGSYFKVWLEGGMYSTFLFLVILIVSLIRSFVYRKNYFVEFPLLLFCMCSLIGANIIDMPYIIAPMWYTIGRINNYEIIEIAEYE